MTTEKPRFTITVDEDTLQKIETYRLIAGISTRSQAIVSLAKLGLATLDKRVDDLCIRLNDLKKNPDNILK